ncbi:DUF5011 domain-containing protein [Niallia sp. Man26]|uniref:DUF5011 domain-containing protein n=1 Tax=Niallia sp. Man26 TaxID=2912824 RepID=UPI001EDC4E68|nr:DUF5011 domain-containing protein [Niallia sp. Man26]UPO91009.1 DUF5011 domain-containing protein [Niallia sp. Man26]
MKKVFCYGLIFSLILLLLPHQSLADNKIENTIKYIPNKDNLLTGAIEQEGQINTYEITPTSSGDMAITQIDDARIWAVLYDENMNSMDMIRDPSVFQVEKGHRYYLKVKMLINIPEKTSNYQFKVIMPNDNPSWDEWNEPNDTNGLAYPLQSGKEAASKLEYKGDRNIYKINVTKEGQIFGTVSNEKPFIQVYDSTGKNVTWRMGHNPDGQYIEPFAWVTPGIYYITVGSPTDELESYNIKFTYPTDVKVEQDVFGEPNDVLQEAKLIEPDKMYNFKFEDEFDVDWYKFVLTEPKKVAFEGNHDQLDIGIIKGLNEQGEFIEEIYGESKIGKDKFQQTSDVLQPGTYYFKVYRYNSWGGQEKSLKKGNYTLKLTYVSPNDVNTIDLPLEQPFTSTIDYSFDKDGYYYHDPNFTGVMQIRIKSKTPVDISVSNPYVKPVITKEGEETVYTFFVWKQERYAIVVSSPKGEYGDTATYTFTATRKEKTTGPEISGVQDVSIPMGGSFDAKEGVTAFDISEGNLTRWIDISGEVDVKMPGTYKIIYSAQDSFENKTIITRKITVYDNVRPVLRGVKDKTININSKFDPKEGVSAEDNIDGNISKNIIVTGKVNTKVKGVYTLTYSIKDNKGNTSKLTRKVTVRDNVKPVISGANNKTIKKHSSFNPQKGVTAKDNVDGNLTKNIKITGIVNTNRKGSYTVTYSVIDKSGNKTTVKRKITVK